MISYIIKETVNKFQHAYDEATTKLLRGYDDTKNPDSQGDQIP